MSGKVYLVGAGPGDPELLTVKALRLLQTAEAVLHDDLVSSQVLQLISPAARVYNVGKRCGQKHLRQEEINFLMATLASSGLRVVRLKCGDPLIFGRAGEEIEALRKANVEYEIVPGVTSALGAAAGAAIPLTHREISSALVLVTGHSAPGKDEADWSKLVASGATLAIYMPGHDYSGIATRLKIAGLSNDTPCAIISRATTSQQQVHKTSIDELPHAPQLPAPTLLIVGEVVRLAGTADSAAQPFSQIDEQFAARVFSLANSIQASVPSEESFT
jgi:uroporphyrin-III C-methyltransferase